MGSKEVNFILSPSIFFCCYGFCKGGKMFSSGVYTPSKTNTPFDFIYYWFILIIQNYELHYDILMDINKVLW
jgi:hypothetical protein